MTSLEWGRLHSVGVEQIDQDHRIISNLVMQLDDAVDTDQRRDIVANIISVIAEFTRHHMRRENSVWQKQGSDTSPSHTNDHAGLVAELELIIARWQDREWTIADDILRLRPLLDAHIHNQREIKYRHAGSAFPHILREAGIGGTANGA